MSLKILEINLSDHAWSVFSVGTADVSLYLGGKGVGLKILFDRMAPGVDPLGPENMLTFMTGVFMGTGAPTSSRFSAVTKSPLTGLFASSNCGGPFGMKLKAAGWDGVLVTGVSPGPVCVEVSKNGAAFSDATTLWGLDTPTTQKRIDSPGACVVIGQAGENRVRYAVIASGDRFLGRCGMGAVMGAKRLKAIHVKDDGLKVTPCDRQKFRKTKKKALKRIKGSRYTNYMYRNFGTAANINHCNAANLLPVKNFSKGNHSDAHRISGEHMVDFYKARHSPCNQCPISCGKKATLKGKSVKLPEYETLGLLGANLEIFDLEKVEALNQRCTRYGIDTISLGGTLAWVMEATEKGILQTGLGFKSFNGLERAIDDIAFQRGFGREMAMGVRFLAEKYGGEEYAMHVKGLELGAYDPRGAFGHALSYAVANRGGCHNSAYVVFQEADLRYLKRFSRRAKAEIVVFNENLINCVNSLSTCLMTLSAYPLMSPVVRFTPRRLLAFFMQNMPGIAMRTIDLSIYADFFTAITGIPMNKQKLLKAGERIHVLERYMNTREGISRKDDTLPARFLNHGLRIDGVDRTVPLNKMLDCYYRIRGFDTDGIPTEKGLNKLKINKKQ